MTGPGTATGEFALPVGTVTFLLTDVEGSTLAWQAAPEAMGAAIARHYEILDTAVSAHGGVRPQEQGEGDSIVAAFGRASDALMAAIDAQHAFGAEPWPARLAKPLRVRMAIHTGEAQTRNEANYVGQAIIRTARLRAIAHGGQVLASQAVRDLVIDQLGDRIELLDLGSHRLKDLARPEHVWQVAADGLDRAFPPLRSLDATPNNLPIELSSFVGRQSEIASVSALINTQRLVTVTGAGGAGKTRLAQQVAANVADQYPDGTWWIELAPIEASSVRTTIAAVLSITEPNRLVERLGGHMLLVLDNCEHVLDTITPLVHQIMTKCPDVTILTTSRGPLDVPGEITWRLPPLNVPEPGTPIAVETLAQYDAVRLFVDRAQRARTNFALTTTNGPAIAELCSRLDGIPLAIELAAARAKSLTAEQILKGLEDALRLLTGGSRLMMPRQQTLEASIRWSHDLLGEPERVLLRRLSVFAGGFDLEGAEAICSDDTGLSAMAVLDALEHLIDQSLVRVDEQGATARYHLLETVRQYADARLTDTSTERDDVRARHTDWYARMALIIGPLAEGPDEEMCMARLTPERDNLAAALRRLQAAGDEAALAEMTLSLGTFWNACQLAAEGRDWCTVALQLLETRRPNLRARLLAARAMHLVFAGNVLAAPGDAQQAIELADQVGDRRTACRARMLIVPTVGWFDPAAGLAMFELALAHARAAGDLYGEVSTLLQKAAMFAIRTEPRSIRAALDAAEVPLRQLDNPFLEAQSILWRSVADTATADHSGMRAIVAVVSKHDARHALFAESSGLRAQVFLRADRGEAIPCPDALEATTRQFERNENHIAAMGVNMSVVEALHFRGELERALTISDEASRAGMVAPRVPINAALLSLALGDVDGAKQRIAKVTPLAPTAPEIIVIKAEAVHALIARHDGDIAAAETAAHHGLTLAHEFGHRRDVVDALEILAGLAAVQGAWAHAARLAGAAQEKRDSHPLKGRVEPLTSMLAADLAATRAALGDEAFEAAFGDGRTLAIDDAVEYAQRMRGERSRPTLGWGSVTPTERKVIDLARHGNTNAAIAKELLMGAETVKTHLSRIYAKLGIANRVQLAALAPPDAS